MWNDQVTEQFQVLKIFHPFAFLKCPFVNSVTHVWSIEERGWEGPLAKLGGLNSAIFSQGPVGSPSSNTFKPKLFQAKFRLTSAFQIFRVEIPPRFRLKVSQSRHDHSPHGQGDVRGTHGHAQRVVEGFLLVIWRENRRSQVSARHRSIILIHGHFDGPEADFCQWLHTGKPKSRGVGRSARERICSPFRERLLQIVGRYDKIQSGLRILEDKFDSYGDDVLILLGSRRNVIVQRNPQLTAGAVRVDCLHYYGVAVGQKIQIPFLSFDLKNK